MHWRHRLDRPLMKRRAFLALSGATVLASLPGIALAHHEPGHGGTPPPAGWVPAALWHPAGPWSDH